MGIILHNFLGFKASKTYTRNVDLEKLIKKNQNTVPYHRSKTLSYSILIVLKGITTLRFKTLYKLTPDQYSVHLEATALSIVYSAT